MPQDPAKKDARRSAMQRDSIMRAHEDAELLAESENTIGGRLRRYMQTRPTSFSEATNDESIRAQMARSDRPRSAHQMIMNVRPQSVKNPDGATRYEEVDNTMNIERQKARAAGKRK